MLLPFTTLNQLNQTERAQVLVQFNQKTLTEIKTPFVTFNGKHINTQEILSAHSGKTQQLNG